MKYTIPLLYLSHTIFSQPQPNPTKPSTCDGILIVQAEIPAITGVDGKPFNQFVGNLTYSLDTNGLLTLNSSPQQIIDRTPNWHCQPLKTLSHSKDTIRTLQNVFGSAQITCQSDLQDLDATWITQWTKVTFSGQLYVSVMLHDGTCGSPTNLLDSASTCYYNVSTDGHLKDNGECSWKTVDHPHHLGDNQQDASQG